MKQCCLLLVLVLLATGVSTAQAQAPAPVAPPAAPVSDLGPRETRVQANRFLTAGDYASAIPLLQQLIQWFADSKNKNIMLDMEGTYFHLGLCHFLLGHFPDSGKAFEEYLKKYPRGAHSTEAAVYIGDGLRFSQEFKKAIAAYQQALDKYAPNEDWRADVLCSMVRCYLAQDDWKTAIPLLQKAYRVAPDDLRTNWAATLLMIAYLKEKRLDQVYELVPYLLRPYSFASRSAAFNLAALETGDELFAEEKYRDALWVYRLVFNRDLIEARCKRHLERLQKEADNLRQSAEGRYRELMRTQEYIGEVEQEIKILGSVQNYSEELSFRIARAYMETRRVWEGRAAFLDLHQELEGEKAEEALSLGFQCAVQIKPWDDAFKIGLQYLDKYPQGKWYDQISLMLGHMHAMQKDWQAVVDLLTKVLKAHPKHESGAECMFLIGYSYFQLEKFPEAAAWLSRLNTQYPGNDRCEEGSYWLAMSLLFDHKYEKALAKFEEFTEGFPKSPYVEDATFRHAACRYALSDFRAAGKELDRFVVAFPQSKLVGEGLMMLADIAGFYGELPKAVARFHEALKHELNIEFYNYCTFRSTEMLCDLKDFPGIISQLEPYIQQNREDSNIPLAVYWVGRAMWQLEKRDEVLTYYLKSVEKFGQNRAALGVDLIVDEWIGHSRSLGPEKAAAAWAALRDLAKQAQESGRFPLALRLQRAFIHQPGISDQEREATLKELLNPDNIQYASAGVMELMLDEAQKRNLTDLATKVATAIVEVFTETDCVIPARMFLARQAVAAREFDTAEKHLNVIRQVFATSEEAAQALLILGNISQEQGKYPEADKYFADILAVKEWRGPLWPAALYGRAETARLQRQYDKAATYYERIYVMYSRYRDWTAKAYLQRARCLRLLNEPGKAQETLQEMLTVAELKDTDEGKEAQTLLAKLQAAK